MKLSVNLLRAMSMGIAVGAVTSSCQQEEVDSRQTKKEEQVLIPKTESSPGKSEELKEKAQKEKEKLELFYKNCPNCGMG